MIGRFALFLLGVGFVALIAFELHAGVAGAKFGAADLSHHPGTYSFFIALQAFLAASLFANALGLRLNASPWLRRWAAIALIAVLALFVWTVLEIAHDMFALGAGMSLSDRLIYGALAIVAMSVLITVGYQFIWLEIRDRFR